MQLRGLVTREQCQARRESLRALVSLPTVLYGAGVYADEVRRFLASLGVEVAGCFVDDDYLSSGRATPGTQSLKEVQAAHPRFHVVLAFCGDPVIARERLKDMPRRDGERIEVVDCRFLEQFESFSHEDLVQEEEALSSLWQWLGDSRSKEVLVGYFNAKLMNDPMGLHDLVSHPQYFPSDLPNFRLTTQDCFLDAGAFTGDTLEQLIDLTGGKGCQSYLGFEPDPENFSKLTNVIDSRQLHWAHAANQGLYREQTKLRFDAKQCSNSRLSHAGTTEIQLETIDSLGLDTLSFLKMDIEGAELAALQGGAETIARCKPKLAITVYHRREDLFRIPQYLKSLCPEYTFYLRIHSFFSEELVLYGACQAGSR